VTRRPLHLTERANDDLGRSVPVEAAPVLLGHDLDAQAATDERGALRAAIHILRDLVECVLERGIRDCERREHLRAEHAGTYAAKAAERAEAVACTSGCGNGGGPIGLHAELVRSELVR